MRSEPPAGHEPSAQEARSTQRCWPWPYGTRPGRLGVCLRRRRAGVLGLGPALTVPVGLPAPTPSAMGYHFTETTNNLERLVWIRALFRLDSEAERDKLPAFDFGGAVNVRPAAVIHKEPGDPLLVRSFDSLVATIELQPGDRKRSVSRLIDRAR